ncbi:hypothetical protein ACX9R5_01185 [Rathayibacter sp. CAU 1779]
MSEPHLPELAELMVRAATAMHGFGLDITNGSGYVPRRPLVEYHENEAGWPATVRDHALISGKSELVDWGMLFGAKKNTVLKYDVDDVPVLQELVTFVAADRYLSDRISPLTAGRDDDELRGQWIANSAVSAASELLERADAMGGTSEEALLSIYGEWELGTFGETVTGDLLFPILLRHFPLDEAFQVGPGISIEPLTRELQCARALRVDAQDVNPFLAAAATHAVVLHDRQFANQDGPMARRIRFDLKTPGMGTADQVFQALSIATGERTGYTQVCLRPHAWATGWINELPPLEQVAIVAHYPPAFNDGGWNKPGSMVATDDLARLPVIFGALASTTQRAKLAARRLMQSYMRDRDDDIILDACIGIEALLGEEHDELVHRMGLRAAMALAPGGLAPDRTYELLKKVYAHRSKIVHGTEPKQATIRFGDQEYPSSGLAVFLLRALLDAHLTATPPWQPAALDAALFDAIGGAERSFVQDEAES